METRRAIRIFPAFDLTYEMKRIPAEAYIVGATKAIGEGE